MNAGLRDLQTIKLCEHFFEVVWLDNCGIHASLFAFFGVLSSSVTTVAKGKGKFEKILS